MWNFIPNWHMKLNYAQGFRPQVCNNLVSNGIKYSSAGSSVVVRVRERGTVDIGYRARDVRVPGIRRDE